MPLGWRLGSVKAPWASERTRNCELKSWSCGRRESFASQDGSGSSKDRVGTAKDHDLQGKDGFGTRKDRAGTRKDRVGTRKDHVVTRKDHVGSGKDRDGTGKDQGESNPKRRRRCALPAHSKGQLVPRITAHQSNPKACQRTHSPWRQRIASPNLLLSLLWWRRYRVRRRNPTCDRWLP